VKNENDDDPQILIENVDELAAHVWKWIRENEAEVERLAAESGRPQKRTIGVTVTRGTPAAADPHHLRAPAVCEMHDHRGVVETVSIALRRRHVISPLLGPLLRPRLTNTQTARDRARRIAGLPPALRRFRRPPRGCRPADGSRVKSLLALPFLIPRPASLLDSQSVLALAYVHFITGRGSVPGVGG
jgi:hypothetical protein